MDTLQIKALDRLARHLIECSGDLASHKMKAIQCALDDHNEKHDMKAAA